MMLLLIYLKEDTTKLKGDEGKLLVENLGLILRLTSLKSKMSCLIWVLMLMSFLRTLERLWVDLDWSTLLFSYA